MLRARTLAASVLFVALGIAAEARADLISDEEAQCQQAAEGAACELGGKPGVCAKSTCHRNDYSDGPPPKSKQVDCLVCMAKDEVPTSDTKDAKTADAKATLSTTETKTAADTKTPSGESKPATTSKSGCASGGTDTGAWQLACIALGLGFVALARRKG